jgi:hypothetical protein
LQTIQNKRFLARHTGARGPGESQLEGVAGLPKKKLTEKRYEKNRHC